MKKKETNERKLDNLLQSEQFSEQNNLLAELVLIKTVELLTKEKVKIREEV